MQGSVDQELDERYAPTVIARHFGSYDTLAELLHCAGCSVATRMRLPHIPFSTGLPPLTRRRLAQEPMLVQMTDRLRQAIGHSGSQVRQRLVVVEGQPGGYGALLARWMVETVQQRGSDTAALVNIWRRDLICKGGPVTRQRASDLLVQETLAVRDVVEAGVPLVVLYTPSAGMEGFPRLLQAISPRPETHHFLLPSLLLDDEAVARMTRPANRWDDPLAGISPHQASDLLAHFDADDYRACNRPEMDR